jgi:hypothetical protein
VFESEIRDLVDTVKEKFHVAAATPPLVLCVNKHIDAVEFEGRLGWGASWDISEQNIYYLRTSLEALTPEGFRYAIAPFLVYALNNPDSDVTDALIINLSHMKPMKGKLSFLRARLSQDETACIADVVRLISRLREGARYIEGSLRAANDAWS